jgi:hypothetical protein
MMIRSFAAILLTASLLATSGCSSVKEALGQGKRSPDEFAVYSRKPLSVPPNFDLRPPADTGARPVSDNPVADARSALLGAPAPASGSAPTAVAGGSAGTMALLDRTGSLRADPRIRSQVNEESTILADADQTMTERLMFWRTPTEYGSVVDPVAEARRIQENQALGKPVTAGPTPTIARQSRALLQGIFN